MVWSGEHCAYKNYCEDGTPLLPGKTCPPSVIRLNPKKPNAGIEMPGGAPPACSRMTSFFRQNSSSGRLLLMSNGSAQGMFERYIADAKREKIDLSLSSLTVILVKPSGARLTLDAPRLQIGQMFKGLTVRQLWLRQLKDLSAAKIRNGEGEASRLSADFICGR
jgi:hypothetical protein